MSRTRVKASYTLAPESIERIVELSKKTRIPQSRLIDEAIEMLDKKYGVKENQEEQSKK